MYHARLLADDLAADIGAPPPLPRGRVARGLDRAAARFRRLDIAWDLAEDIGSRRWWRGLGLLLGLIAFALLCAPGLSPVEAAQPAWLDGEARAQLAQQAFRPLSARPLPLHQIGGGMQVMAVAEAPERPRLDLVTTLAAGDSFAHMLTRAGVGAGDAARIADYVGKVQPIDRIAPGTAFQITLGPREAPGLPRPLEKLAFRARFDLALALSRSSGGFAYGEQKIAVDETPLRIRGLAGGSLYRSARAAGAPPAAIQQYLQALDAHMSLDAVEPGDSFDMILAYKRSAGGEIQPGNLLYAGLDSAGEAGGHPRVQLMRWGNDGQFFDAAGGDSSAQTVSGLIMPVSGGHITSNFGMRFHPILGYSRMHQGIDIGAAWGSPIYAVADGMVSYAGPHGGHGNFVRLDHGGGFGTGYAHMSRIGVSPGERVRAGQVIGYVGSTGLSTGPHLHYEVYQGGVPVDPASASFTVRAGIDVANRSEFKARLARLLLVKPGAALAPVGGGFSGSPLR